jgi:hypothetical protein
MDIESLPEDLLGFLARKLPRAQQISATPRAVRARSRMTHAPSIKTRPDAERMSA